MRKMRIVLPKLNKSKRTKIYRKPSYIILEVKILCNKKSKNYN